MIKKKIDIYFYIILINNKQINMTNYYYELPDEIIELIELKIYDSYLNDHKTKMHISNMIISKIGNISSENRAELLLEGYDEDAIGEEDSCTNIHLYVKTGWEDLILNEYFDYLVNECKVNIWDNNYKINFASKYLNSSIS